MTATFPPELTTRFEPLRMLGQGGMGTVWAARRKEDERQVAVKVLHTALCENATLLRRFEREATLACRNLHPVLVQALEAGTLGSVQYVASELIEGETLQDLLSLKRPLTVRRTLSIGREIAAALQALHAAEIVHRDLKPANIMIQADGKVRLLDLGIAGVSDQYTRLTATGTLVGTYHYMAPETCRLLKATAAADVYALGVVMLDCLSSLSPFRGAPAAPGAFMVARATGKEKLPMPSDCDPVVVELLKRLTALDPAARPKDGKALCTVLDEAVTALKDGRRQGTVNSRTVGATRQRVKTLAPVSTVAVEPVRRWSPRRILPLLTILAVVPFLLSLLWPTSPPARQTRARLSPLPSPRPAVAREPGRYREPLEKYAARLEGFVVDPRLRASDPKLRRPSEVIPPREVKRLVLEHLLELRTATSRQRIGAGELRKYSTCFVGLLDLYLRTPPVDDRGLTAQFHGVLGQYASYDILALIEGEKRYWRSVTSAKSSSFAERAEAGERLVRPDKLEVFNLLTRELKNLRRREADRDGPTGLLVELIEVFVSAHAHLIERAQGHLTALERRLPSDEKGNPVDRIMTALFLYGRCLVQYRKHDFEGLKATYLRAERLVPESTVGEHSSCLSFAIQIRLTYIKRHFVHEIPEAKRSQAPRLIWDMLDAYEGRPGYQLVYTGIEGIAVDRQVKSRFPNLLAHVREREARRKRSP